MMRCPSCGGRYDGAPVRCPLDGAALVEHEDGPIAPPGFELGARLGEGALAEVFAARREEGGEVALKIMKEGPARSPALRARFVREARLASRVRHPRVVAVEQVFDAPRPVLVLELVDGAPLSAVLASRPPALDAARIVLDVALALDAAHAASVLHRDVKPANVLVERQGGAKLVDFGLARAQGDDRLTATGELLGTPRYLAPEAALGGAEAASDLYALGCVAFEIVAGRPPFVGTIREMLAAHAGSAPPRLDGALGPLVAALLEKSPAARPTARDVVAAVTLLVTRASPT